MNKLIKIVFIAVLFFCPLEINCMDQPIAKNGLLDLSEWDFEKNGTIKLNGEWEFYWENFYEYNDFETGLAEKPQLIKVPENWNKYINKNNYGKGYGTYRLKIHLPASGSEYALIVKPKGSSYTIHVNNNLINRIGKTGKSRSEATGSYQSKNIQFNTNHQEIDLIIHISNYQHPEGGIRQEIYLGPRTRIKSRFEKEIAMTLFFIGSFLIIGLYNIILYIIRKKERYLLFFGIFCLLLTIRGLFSNYYFIYLFGNFNWNYIIKIEYLSFYMAVPTFGLLVYSLFPIDYSRKIAHIYFIGSAIYTIPVLMLPPRLFLYGSDPFEISIFLLGIYILYVTIKARNKGRNGIKAFIAGFILFFVSVINDILHNNEIYTTANISSYGLFIFILFQSYIISVKYSKKFSSVERLSKNLNIVNQSLEMMVDARTMEVSLKNESIEKKNKLLKEQKEEISAQKEHLEQKNIDITDSINYASKIQSAILPPKYSFERHFKDSLILYKPRDIIGGDFYWLFDWGEKLFFGVGDCTGHGVPGSLMSVLSLNLLNETVNQYTSTFTAPSFKIHHILNILRSKIKIALNQTEPDGENQEGLDIGLCVFDKITRDIQFSGAYFSLLIIREKSSPFPYRSDVNVSIKPLENNYELIQIKGDKMPIGIYLVEKEFKNFSFQLSENDKLYIMSDGFPDQIGGELGKKFQYKSIIDLISKIYTKPFKEQEKLFMETFANWLGEDYDQVDDATILGLMVK